MDITHERKELQKLARLIAVDMQWTYVQPTDNDRMDHAVLTRGPMSIDIRYDRNTTGLTHLRIQTWGWPSYTSHNRGDIRTTIVTPSMMWGPKESDPSIRCAIKRGHAAIAQDIGTRFIPEYVRIWNRCKERADSCQIYNDEEWANWSAICVVIGQDPNHTNRYVEIPFGNGFKTISVSEEHKGAVLAFSVTPTELVKVLEALKSIT